MRRRPPASVPTVALADDATSPASGPVPAGGVPGMHAIKPVPALHGAGFRAGVARPAAFARGLALALTLVLAPLLPAPLSPVARALAVEPGDVLADPALEARARALGRQLRCPVCQGESIDDSNAPVARDLRLLVRERLVAGDSDAQVLDYITVRYGEYVLFQPAAEGMNLILWFIGPASLVVALGGVGLMLRRRRGQAAKPPPPLSEAEAARIAELMRD